MMMMRLLINDVMGVIKIFDDDDDDEKSYLKYLFIFKYNLRVNDKQTMMLI